MAVLFDKPRRQAPGAPVRWGSMLAREQRLMTLSAVFAVLVTVAMTLAGVEQMLGYAAPLLVVLLPLLAGRFVGEERMVRATARARSARVRPRSTSVPRAWLRGVSVFPRGGLLIARAIAVRPPPAAHSL